MEDLEIISEELLTELFNMGSAKGYPYTVSAPGEYPADPAITFQAVFTDDHGTEFAFRVYKANLIQGTGQRKYGKNTRVLAFMRRKTKNFAQNITVDSGTFKKVLVTFMQCYTEYKDSKDGPLASSYAIILQSSLKPYATLFVRATARAFKSNRKLHLSLYGVQEEGTNGSIELLYVNPQTIYPYWGGPEFDEAKFVGNPTHVKLSKLEGHEVAPAVAGQVTPVSTAGDPVVTPAATAADPVAANLPDPMNNPTAFNDELFSRLHFAKGRDDFASILRDVRVHRQYLQEHFSTLFDALYVGKSLDSLFTNVNLNDWKEGIGFYLKRYDEVAYAYIMVYVTNSKTKVEDLAVEIRDLSAQVSTLRSNAGNAKTGGSISELFGIMQERLNVATAQQLLNANVSNLSTIITSAAMIMNGADSANIGARSTMFNAFVSRNPAPYGVKDMNKLAVLGYYTDIVSADIAIDVIEDSVGAGNRINQGNTTLITSYSDLFDNSGALIDALVTKYDGMIDLTFGSGTSLEMTLFNLFKDGRFDQFRMQGATKLVKTDDLATLISGFMKTAPVSFVDSHVVDAFNDNITLSSRYDFNESIVDAFAARLITLPVGEDLSTASETALLGQLRYSYVQTSSKGRGITEYFKKRPAKLYYWLLTDTNSSMDKDVLKSIPPNFDLDAYVDAMISTFQGLRGVDFTDFNFSVLSPAVGPYMTVDQVTRLINAGLLNTAELARLSKTAPAVTDAYLNAGKTITDMLKDMPSMSDNMQHRLDMMAKIYANSPQKDQEAAKAAIIEYSFKGYVEGASHILGADVINDHIINNADLYVPQMKDRAPVFIQQLTPEALNAVLGRTLDVYNRLPSPSNIIEGLDMGDKWGDLDLDIIQRMFNKVNTYDRSMAPSSRAEFEEVASRLVVEVWTKDRAQGEAIFNKMPIEERRLVSKAVHSKSFMMSTKAELAGDNVPIKPLVDLDPQRINQILKYNDIKVPRVPQVRDTTTLTELMAKGVGDTPINKLAVVEDPKTDTELEEMAIEYDAFNRYKHGNIAVKFIKAFNVSIPVQEKGFADWVAKMTAEGTDPQIMRPMFHGTGSVAASMILRYGFKVISASDASVVGRMLGDGIYFSNVLDKVSQYMSDGGYSRGAGVRGYIFEMEVSLGMYNRDFNAAGPGTGYSGSRVISPEWAVYNANDQIRIYRAYECILIDKSDMDVLKSKHGINENTSVVGIKHFTRFINEASARGKMKNAAVFIFMDGTIPVSRTKAVDFENFDPSKFGKHVQTDWSGSGPTVQIATDGPGGVFCVRYTNAMMHDRDKINHFLDLLNNR